MVIEGLLHGFIRPVIISCYSTTTWFPYDVNQRIIHDLHSRAGCCFDERGDTNQDEGHHQSGSRRRQELLGSGSWCHQEDGKDLHHYVGLSKLICSFLLLLCIKVVILFLSCYFLRWIRKSAFLLNRHPVGDRIDLWPNGFNLELLWL